MKRIGSSLLILFLLFTILYIPSQNAHAAGEPTSNADIIIDNYIITNIRDSSGNSVSNINSECSFELALVFKNTTDADISNITVEIKDGNFYPKKYWLNTNYTHY